MKYTHTHTHTHQKITLDQIELHKVISILHWMKNADAMWSQKPKYLLFLLVILLFLFQEDWNCAIKKCL